MLARRSVGGFEKWFTRRLDKHDRFSMIARNRSLLRDRAAYRLGLVALRV